MVSTFYGLVGAFVAFVRTPKLDDADRKILQCAAEAFFGSCHKPSAASMTQTIGCIDPILAQEHFYSDFLRCGLNRVIHSEPAIHLVNHSEPAAEP